MVAVPAARLYRNGENLNSSSEPAASDPVREKSANTHALGVVTGVLDDSRKVLDPANALYGAATVAYEMQNHWSDREHAVFWTAMLPAWPNRRGNPPVRDGKAVAVAHLSGFGIGRAKVAELLDIPVKELTGDLIREHGAALIRGRESVARPTNSDDGCPSERPQLSLRLPTVFVAEAHGQPPDGVQDGTLNSRIPIAAILGYMGSASPAGDSYIRRALKVERDLWRRGHLQARRSCDHPLRPSCDCDPEIFYSEQPDPELARERADWPEGWRFYLEPLPVGSV